MKYTEINISKKMIGENYLIYDWHETGNEINIYVKSQTHQDKCPKCGRTSSRYHATYKRIIQSVPIRLKTTYIRKTAYKYRCENEKCNQKIFMEELTFAGSCQTRTRELTSLILAVSIFLSSEGASRVFRYMGV